MLKKTHDYDDIINCPRPDQSKRGGIKVDERAELFASFEALNSPDENLLTKMQLNCSVNLNLMRRNSLISTSGSSKENQASPENFR